MPESYVRLTNGDREEISRGLASDESMTAIAGRIGRSPSTVSNEVGRNGGIFGYRANLAERRARRKASSRKCGHRKITKNPALLAEVISGLMSRWSPNQIAKTLWSTYPGDRNMRLSPETIYQYIYVLSRGSLKAELIKGLRQERKYRRKRKTKMSRQEETRGKIADMLSIEKLSSSMFLSAIPVFKVKSKYPTPTLGSFLQSMQSVLKGTWK